MFRNPVNWYNIWKWYHVSQRYLLLTKQELKLICRCFYMLKFLVKWKDLYLFLFLTTCWMYRHTLSLKHIPIWLWPISPNGSSQAQALFVFLTICVYIKWKTTPPSKRLVKRSAWQKTRTYTKSKRPQASIWLKGNVYRIHKVNACTWEVVRAHSFVWLCAQRSFHFILIISRRHFICRFEVLFFCCFCWQNRCEGGDKKFNVMRNMYRFVEVFLIQSS